VKINYSGGVIRARGARISPVASSHSPAPTRRTRTPTLANNKGGDVLYFPILLGAITLSYNLEGVDKLMLSPRDDSPRSSSAISRSGNDKEIAADNPGAKLPDSDIVVAHRSDGSGNHR